MLPTDQLLNANNSLEENLIFDAFKTYLGHKGLSHATVKNYLSDIRKLKAWYEIEYQQKLTLVDLSTQQLEKAIEFFSHSLYEPNIIKRISSSIRSFSEWACKEQYISRPILAERSGIITTQQHQKQQFAHLLIAPFKIALPLAMFMLAALSLSYIQHDLFNQHQNNYISFKTDGYNTENGQVLAIEPSMQRPSTPSYVTYPNAAVFYDPYFATIRLENFAYQDENGNWVGPDFLVAQSNGQGMAYLQPGGSLFLAGMINASSALIRGDIRLTGNIIMDDAKTVDGVDISELKLLENSDVFTSSDYYTKSQILTRLLSYLPLSGGTLTGILSGINATFSGSIVGNLTGNVTGDVTGNATGLSGSPSIVISGLTLPTGASAGYVLQSDANGVAIWADVSATAGPWTLAGSNLYPDDTTYAVGVGTTSPDAKIESESTTEQLRLTYTDNTDYSSFTVDSGGDLAIYASGGDISLSSGNNLNLSAAVDLIFGSTTSLGETTGSTDSGAYLIGIFNEFNNSASDNLQAVINDLDAAISSATHDPVTLAGPYDYLTLSNQQITLGQIDLISDVTGTLPILNGGTGATTLNNLIALGTHTTGNYIATIADAGNSTISVVNSGTETAAVTLDVIGLNCADCINTSQIADIYLLNSGDTSTGDLTFNKADPSLIFDVATASDTDFWLGVQDDAGGNDNDKFQIGDGTTPGTNPFLTIDTAGNVGIGNASPAGKLHVFSGASGATAHMYADDLVVENSSYGGLTVLTPNNVIGYMLFGDNDAGGEDVGGFFYNHSLNRLAIKTNDSIQVVIESDGKLGLGTTSPDYALQVNGVIAPETTDQDLGTTLLRWDLLANTIDADSTATLTGLANDLTEATGVFINGTNQLVYREFGTLAFSSSPYDNYVSWTAQDGDTDTYPITSGDTLQIASGTGITSNFTADDVLTITNSDLGSSQFIFKTIDAPSGTDPVADANSDTLQFLEGSGITITGDSGADSLSIASTLGTSISGSEVDANTLDFIDFEDTLDLDANLTLNQTAYTWTQNFTGDTTTGFTYNANSLTTGTALSLASTSTAGGDSGTSKLLNIARSGINTNASHTAYGLYSAVTNTGTTSTNIAGYFSALGATNNYGLIVENGSVGIGATVPGAKLEVEVADAANIAGILIDNNDTTNDTPGMQIDMAENGGAPLLLSPLSAAPNTTGEGSIYYDSDVDNLYVYADGGWVDLTVQGGAGPFTDGAGITYLTDAAEDLAIGGTTLAASMFGIDESAGNFYLGYDNSANPTLNFEATDSDAGEFGFNTNDAFYFSNGSVGIGDTSADDTLDVDGGVNFDLVAGSSVVIDGDTTDKTADALSIDVGTLTNGVDGVYTDLNVAGNTGNDADTFSGMNILAANNATDQSTDDNIYGLYVQNLGGTPLAGNEYGIYQAGTGWDYGLYVEDAAYFAGNVTTASYSGGGLSADCDSSTSKILWDSATSTFSCGTDRASLHIRKASNEIVNNSTTFQNDDDFSFSIGANETWMFEITAQMLTSAVSDLKTRISCPAGATGVFYTASYQQADSNVNSACGTSTAISSSTDEDTVVIAGTVVNGGTPGTIQLDWAQVTVEVYDTTMYAGSSMIGWKTSGADLAEIFYTDDQSILPGDVVSLNPLKEAGIIKSTTAYNKAMLGVVSTKPGQILGEGIYSGRPIPVALSGRVPVHIADSSDPIKPGDYITSSEIPGKAKKATQTGETIGKALENWEPNSGKESILIFLNLSWYSPASSNPVMVELPNGLTAPTSVNNLKVDDTISADRLDINQSALIDVNLSLNSNAIESLSGNLYFQKHGLGDVNFFAGKIQLNANGDAHIQNTLSATTLVAQNYQVKGATQNPTIGQSIIKAGESNITVKNTSVKDGAKIFITPKTIVESPLSVIELNPSNSFTVALNKPSQNDITFDYWIINMSE